MNIVIKKCPKDIVTKISKEFAKYQKRTNNIYILAFFIKNDITISVYKNYTIMLQSKNPKIISNFIVHYGLPFDFVNEVVDKVSNENICGCDEVGNGDFFGPIVTCACCVNKNDIDRLKDCGVKDSKLLTDEQIINIYEKINKFVVFSHYVCLPRQYNDLYKAWDNQNIIKSFCHNECLKQLNLDNNYKIVMDQFVSKNLYIKYLHQIDEQNIINIDIFETKAESKYIAVATASIIARYYFIKTMDELSRKCGYILPYGSSQIDKIVKIGKKIDLKEFAKIHFKSITDKII